MTDRPHVAVMRLPHGEGLPLPAYQSAGAAGLDLVAALPHETRIGLEPGRRQLIPTGLALELPVGFEGQIRPRSGLARDYGVTVLNTPGTIDSDYRGEVLVLLINLGETTFEILRGARIAQLVVAPVSRAVLIEVADLSGTSRGGAGFGSTGITTSSDHDDFGLNRSKVMNGIDSKGLEQDAGGKPGAIFPHPAREGRR